MESVAIRLADIEASDPPSAEQITEHPEFARVWQLWESLEETLAPPAGTYAAHVLKMTPAQMAEVQSIIRRGRDLMKRHSI